MTRTLAAIALIAALLQGAAQAEMPPAGSEAHARVVVSPKWAKAPNGEDFANLYPPVALRAGLSGSVTLECLVRLDGHLDPCRVANEDPIGVGFAEATLKMISKFSMHPGTVDGTPVDNAAVRFTVKWQLPPGYGPNPEQPPPTLGEARDHDPQAVPIALRIADLSAIQDYGLNTVSERFHQPPDTAVDPNDKARQEALAQAFQASFGEAIREERDHFAAALVFAFSRQELMDIESFLKTSTGAGFVRKLIVVITVTFAQQNSTRIVMLDNWRKHYCAKVACNARELEKFQQIRADLVNALGSKAASKQGRGP